MLAGIYHDQEVRILFRVKGLEYLTEQEFNAIIEESISKRNEMHISNEKKWIKLNDAFNYSLNNMSNVIKHVIKDTDRLEKAMASLEKYKEAMYAMITHMATCNYRDNKVLSNYHSTEAELLETTNALNINRRKVYDVFVELYVYLGNSLSNEEWTSATKSMKSLL
jgi:aconitase A